MFKLLTKILETESVEKNATENYFAENTTFKEELEAAFSLKMFIYFQYYNLKIFRNQNPEYANEVKVLMSQNKYL